MLVKEISFKRCFVNGKKSGVASYDNQTSLLLFFGSALGAGDLNPVELQKEVAAAGGSLSLHQFNNAWRLSSGDEKGIKEIISNAVIDWEGSEEYEARKAAARGSRGGSSTSSTATTSTAASAATATKKEDDVITEYIAPDPSELVSLGKLFAVLPIQKDVEQYGKEFATSLVNETDAPQWSANMLTFAVVPGLKDAISEYEKIIRIGVEYWKSEKVRLQKEKEEKEKKEREEKERKEKEAAAALEAARNGKTLVTLADGSSVGVTGRVHREFAKIFQLQKLGRNVYAYGPAGTGKSVLASQLCEAWGLDFYPFGKIDDIYTTLLGNPDVNGNYVESPFYKAYTKGGFAFFDEIDASDPSAVTWLNGAIENGFATFPVVGRVDMHPNFRCFAAGNTIGLGADCDYTGRNQLDQAFRRRFAFVLVDYDPEIDALNAAGDKDLLNFVLAVRKAVKSSGVSLVVSSAEIKWLKKSDGLFSKAQNLEYNLFKGLDKTNLNSILGAYDGPVNEWFEAFKELAA